MAAQFYALNEGELLEFFGVEPVERVVDDGYWCYQILDERGVALRFLRSLAPSSTMSVISPAVSASMERRCFIVNRQGWD